MTTTNSRRLISILGVLYLLHFLSINALVAAPGTLSAVSQSDYVLNKVENKKPVKSKKKPYSLFIAKHMAGNFVRVASNVEPLPSFNPLLSTSVVEEKEFPGTEWEFFNSLPDDAFKRYRLFGVFLI